MMDEAERAKIPLTPAEFKRRCTAAAKRLRLAQHDLAGLKMGGFDEHRVNAFTEGLRETRDLMEDFYFAQWDKRRTLSGTGGSPVSPSSLQSPVSPLHSEDTDVRPPSNPA